MKHKILSSLTCVLVSSLLFTSCIKNNVDDLGDAGSTWLKFMEAPENALYFEPFTTVDTVKLFSLRKDANSNAMLNTASTLTLTSLPDVINSYNDDNGTSFETLPDSIFTQLNSQFVKSSAGYTVEFAAGDFAKEFDIALDGSKWDISHTYALALSVSSTSTGTTPLPAQDTIIVFFSVKNEYDGTYSSEGYFYHPSSPRTMSATKTLSTAGPYSFTVSVGDLGSSYLALVTVDPNTNALTITAKTTSLGAFTMLTDGLPTSSPGYTAAWESSSLCNNTYDPTTKTFYLRYGYTSSGVWRVVEEILTKQ